MPLAGIVVTRLGAGRGQRGRRLQEDIGKRLVPLGGDAAPLDDVPRVVARQQKDLPGRANRHEQLDLVDGDRELV